MSTVILPKGVSRGPVLDFHKRRLDGLSPDTEWVLTIEERGEHRSAQQNRLQHKWHSEAANQLRDESAEDKRAFCKLHFGVPILRAEDPEFRIKYDQNIRPLSYDTKLDLMKEPFDFPVTRLMTVKQKTRFMDRIWEHYTSLGVRLTHPDDQGRVANGN